jgi:hypothetical protein
MAAAKSQIDILVDALMSSLPAEDYQTLLAKMKPLVKKKMPQLRLTMNHVHHTVRIARDKTDWTVVFYNRRKVGGKYRLFAIPKARDGSFNADRHRTDFNYGSITEIKQAATRFVHVQHQLECWINQETHRAIKSMYQDVLVDVTYTVRKVTQVAQAVEAIATRAAA